MADIPFAVPDPVGSAAQGLTQGFQLGMQARQAKWERMFQKASLAVQVGANENVPEGARIKALNAGLLPLLNDKRFGLNQQTEAFTPEDLQDKLLNETFTKIQKIQADKDLSPSMKNQFQRELMIGYYQQKGKAKEAAKMQEDLLKDQAENEKTGLKNATDLRQEFINRPEVKDYQIVVTNVGAMDTLMEKARKGNVKSMVALDQALITMFNKLTDPQGTVRESEYERTPENIALANRFVGAVEKIKVGGAGISKDDREALIWGAKIIGKARESTYAQLKSNYDGLAGKYNVDPSLVTGTISQQFNLFNTDQPPAGGGAGAGGASGGSGRQPTTAEEYLQGLPK